MVLVSACGEVSLNLNTTRGVVAIWLTHVALVKGFFVNIFGLSRCLEQQIHFDSGRHILYQFNPKNVICDLEFNAVTQYEKPSHDPRKPVEVIAEAAHRPTGHAGQKAVEKLAENVIGIKLLDKEALKWKHCDCCIQAKMTKQISHWPSSPLDQRFQRIALDII
ncbi:hypothetical protein BU25DRAFT_347973 [Macroventuria anomochaeta]|uniref:Uncharacterized protein n=1 Tax=Macroventuria anomochaeta TaxID=301207 RepID=A0ACB6RRK1_9PLEO|nr:uncharacterized protein BU25DRAFT_347973 [Macroventuria anomochaeta]KAF2624605.1 hypothetical protein BU25DRAFT_347973 [Macroventuria anomochaeta]